MHITQIFSIRQPYLFFDTTATIHAMVMFFADTNLIFYNFSF